MPRVEDARLLTGAGTFTTDLAFPGTARAIFVRSQAAHARIVAIDTAAARACPGVLAVFIAADLAADGIPDIPLGFSLGRPGGFPPPPASRPILAREFVRFVGEPIAMVVAETETAAADAGERVLVEYDELTAVISIEDARSGAASVWPEAPDNIGFAWTGGDPAATEAAFARAAHVSRRTMRVGRVGAHPMEGRAALGRVDATGRMVLHIGHQQPFALRDTLARAIFRVEPAAIRIVVPDVGGSFGLKTGVHSEEVAVLWAARRLGRPVRWAADRSEAFLGDDHSRDVEMEAALALDADGAFLAFAVRFDVNVGCYLSGRSTSTVNNMGGAAGVYRIPSIHAEVFGVLTHTVPTGPYRGAGRPEATFAIERIIDIAARETGRDPFALRRQNLIGRDQMPFRTALTFTYDCGDFAGTMEEAAAQADVADFPARRAAAAARGRLLGLGVANLIESAGGPFGRVAPDSATLVAQADGTVVLTTGALSTGQGIETSLSDMAARRLGIPRERIVYRSGDTDALTLGRGNGGSGASGVSAAAVAATIEAFIERAYDRAADRLEASRADLAFADGAFTVVGTDLRCTLAQLCEAEDLAAAATFQPGSVTFPNGCHICEAEVDPQTGEVCITRYLAIEDIGHVLDATLVEGQLHGGIAQGLGQAVLEQMQYDGGSGQLVTGSFMDYAMPRATDMPALTLGTRATITAVNALGAKGVGEAGTVGSLVTVTNAICDALASRGIVHVDMPASPAAIWSALNGARS